MLTKTVSSRHKPGCFWHGAPAAATVLKVVVRRLILLVLPENITSCACLDKSELKIIFHLYVDSDFFSELYLVDHLRYWGHRELRTVKCHIQRV